MNLKSTDLYIFRHGETDWNRQMRFQGHTDIPLNHEGIVQAKNLSSLVEPLNVQMILSSNLQRARVTAEIVNEKMQVPMLISEDLRECGLGDLEGLERSVVIEKYGDQWQRWLSIDQDDLDFAFNNGESKRAHLFRLQNYIQAHCLQSDLQRIGISTHGGSLRRLIHACEGAPTEPAPIPNCALYHVRLIHADLRWVFVGRIE
jgi:broad specificity phosphatase PhoE